VNASYRLGTLVVVGVVAASAALCLASALRSPPYEPPPAGQDLGEGGFDLGRFRLVDSSGRSVGDSDLAGGPWVAAFIFTRCPTSCPQITAVMKGVQDRLAGTGVRLVSISVDPEYDTPDVLARYALRAGADPGRWSFLTGRPEDVEALIRDKFKLILDRTGDPAEGADEGFESISHSDRLALVAPGNRLVGYFRATDESARKMLLVRARLLDRPLLSHLPEINAALNGTSGVLLLLGWALIRRGRARAHISSMVSALSVSALFLGCYLVYHFLVLGGLSFPFRGVGPIRVVYFTILLSHTVLAISVVPLVALTLYRAVRRRFAAHLRIARVTFPIWLYVSITGVVVYLMLYRLDVPTTLSP
jgi:protein SCO1/2